MLLICTLCHRITVQYFRCVASLVLFLLLLFFAPFLHYPITFYFDAVQYLLLTHPDFIMTAVRHHETHCSAWWCSRKVSRCWNAFGTLVFLHQIEFRFNWFRALFAPRSSNRKFRTKVVSISYQKSRKRWYESDWWSGVTVFSYYRNNKEIEFAPELHVQNIETADSCECNLVLIRIENTYVRYAKNQMLIFNCNSNVLYSSVLNSHYLIQTLVHSLLSLLNCNHLHYSIIIASYPFSVWYEIYINLLAHSLDNSRSYCKLSSVFHEIKYERSKICYDGVSLKS